MNKMMTMLSVGMLIGFPLTVEAAGPLDVYNGERRNSRYPSVEATATAPAQSSKVKIQSKETLLLREGPDRSQGEEVVPLPGIISKDGVVIEQPREKEDSPETADGATEQYPCYGVWNKVGFFVEGAAHPFDPVILTLNKDAFSSVAPSCSASGAFTATLTNMTLVMTSTNCPGNIPVPLTITYAYQVSEDGQTLTFWTALVKEIYTRK